MTKTFTLGSLPQMVKPTQFKHEGFISRKIQDNSNLVSLLGSEFYYSSYVRASESADNFQYVGWQRKTNQSNCRLIKEIDDMVLVQSGQSNRYYLISTKSGSIIAIQRH